MHVIKRLRQPDTEAVARESPENPKQIGFLMDWSN